MPLETASDSQARRFDRVLSLDPGIRTFQTGYDPSGWILEFGKANIGHIYRICAHMDDLQSRIYSKTVRIGPKSRYRMRRAWRKMQWRIRSLVDEVHKKMVRFILANYAVVLLPTFESKDMVLRAKRKICSKTARALMTWSHYRFKTRLLFKRKEFPWCKVVICEEDYTSRTCGRCGDLHPSLGGQGLFRCPSCKLRIGRDINGARNILLKNASHFAFGA